ncbi:MAG: beta/gamma crystallin-related protein [Ramlibacter sp.]
MNPKLKYALAISAMAMATQALAQVTFYEGEGFRGRAFTTAKRVNNFDRHGFNDRSSSVVVERGRWEACEDANFGGRCVVLRRGSYGSLEQMGLSDQISSARPADNRRRYDNEAQAPMEQPDYAWRRRSSERVFEAPVTSVRAVMAAPTQRCWVERQQVAEPVRGDRNLGGAIAGALIGGVLGHQVGGGSGKDLATVGGAVAGGWVGSNVGRSDSVAGSRDVQRCEDTVSGTPAYWDVGYRFRGKDHQVQTSAAPGQTISVNREGEPRQ